MRRWACLCWQYDRLGFVSTKIHKFIGDRILNDFINLCVIVPRKAGVFRGIAGIFESR